MDGGSVIERRRALKAAGAAACGVAALAACGDGTPQQVPGIKGKEIAKTADVPVGGGTVVKQYKIVVTQPSEGVFKAYSASCPHRGCAVSTPKDNVMTCPCHGSEFDAATGQATKGPASGSKLVAYEVKVQGDGIVVV